LKLLPKNKKTKLRQRDHVRKVISGVGKKLQRLLYFFQKLFLFIGAAISGVLVALAHICFGILARVAILIVEGLELTLRLAWAIFSCSYLCLVSLM
jgi:hypothetical protein